MCMHLSVVLVLFMTFSTHEYVGHQDLLGGFRRITAARFRSKGKAELHVRHSFVFRRVTLKQTEHKYPMLIDSPVSKHVALNATVC